MSTPIHEKEQYSFPAFEPNLPSIQTQENRSVDEDGTLHELEDGKYGNKDGVHLRLTTSYADGPDDINQARNKSPMSPAVQREHSRRLEDDLEMLRAERVVSDADKASQENTIGRSKSMARTRSRTAAEPVDDFDVDTTPIHEKTKVYQPPAHPTTKFAKLFKKIHESSFVIRWFTYITPITLLLLVPIMLGIFRFESASVGGVELLWFGIWLEIVWLTLWAGRLIAKCIPYPMGLISSLFTNSDKKWRDLGKALEVPATIFFWWLAIEISFLPTMKNHHLDGNKDTRSWEYTVNKIIVSIFVGVCLNFFEKVIIQLIAISFHLRTYADRIEINKFQISSLVKLYIFSKEKIAMDDSEFEPQMHTGGSSGGARTPMIYAKKAQKNARHAFHKVGDVVGKVAGDFTGRAVVSSTHPHQVILQLLNSTSGSQVLARRLYRTFAHEDSETVFADDLRNAFDNEDEADAAFTMFDKDLNGDISMEEIEAVCVEIGRERKAITASLKDLDSVVSKLDDVFLFIVFVITILVFVSLISTSASGVLTSAGSAVLALSWLFSATAQEFLQSCIWRMRNGYGHADKRWKERGRNGYGHADKKRKGRLAVLCIIKRMFSKLPQFFVFVKHPCDVGDRVTIDGNTGSQFKGDDYFVQEISLLFTEFPKMEGHIVQAPNSDLNPLFILNQRRSGGLAEAVPVTIKFGTTLEQIEGLRARLLEFVSSENREYQKNILTELTTIYEAYSITLNVVFFYKSNWQNELLRLQRRNKFICAMMVTMNELGIEGPRMRLAGAAQEFPVYLSNAFPPSASSQPGSDSLGPRSGPLARENPIVPPASDNNNRHHPSIIRTRAPSSLRQRGESISAMGKRVDFSLGMSAISSGADFGDIYEDRVQKLPPKIRTTSPALGSSGERDRGSEDLERVTSLESGISRIITGSSGTGQKVHRNRFFSRNRSKLGNPDEETSLQDLQSGTKEFGANDMPDIPEASGANSANLELDDREGRKGTRARVDFGSLASGNGRIDPRTGIVSPQAVTSDIAYERGELPTAGGFGAPRKANTEQVRKHI